MPPRLPAHLPLRLRGLTGGLTGHKRLIVIPRVDPLGRVRGDAHLNDFTGFQRAQLFQAFGCF